MLCMRIGLDSVESKMACALTDYTPLILCARACSHAIRVGPDFPIARVHVGRVFLASWRADSGTFIYATLRY